MFSPTSSLSFFCFLFCTLLAFVIHIIFHRYMNDVPTHASWYMLQSLQTMVFPACISAVHEILLLAEALASRSRSRCMLDALSTRAAMNARATYPVVKKALVRTDRTDHCTYQILAASRQISEVSLQKVVVALRSVRRSESMVIAGRWRCVPRPRLEPLPLLSIVFRFSLYTSNHAQHMLLCCKQASVRIALC